MVEQQHLVARVVAMHEGRRRKKAERDAKSERQRLEDVVSGPLAAPTHHGEVRGIQEPGILPPCGNLGKRVALDGSELDDFNAHWTLS